MKKILLLVCALPCLLNAQNATVRSELNEKKSIQQAIKSRSAERLNQVRTYVGAKQNLFADKLNQVRPYVGAAKSLPAAKQNRTVTYAGEANVLPDSVYTYSDEAKTELEGKAYFKYNEKGWPVEQRTVYEWEGYNWELDDFVMMAYESKDIYEYAVENGLLTMKITSYYLEDGKWEIESEGGIQEFIFKEADFNKFFTSQQSFEQLYLLYVLEMNIYYFDDAINEWFAFINLKAVEFNSAGRPTVYDYTELYYDYDDHLPIEFKMRVEADYNPQGLMSAMTIFVPTGNPASPWEQYQVEEYFYNGALQLVKSVFNDNDGEHGTYEYEYNDKGLLIKESQLSDDYSDIYEYQYDEYGNLCYMKNYWEYSYYDEEDDDYYSCDGEYEEFYVNYYPEGVANETILSVQSAVYPNPASDVLNVRITGADEALITLVSMTGSAVYQQKTTQPLVTIPVQSLTKGYYILTVQTAGQTKSHKVIIR